MSHNDLLRIQNLKVCAGEKEILHGIDLDIHENEVHVLMGPNGTGKSTLGAALMGNPAYTVTGGDASTYYVNDAQSSVTGTGGLYVIDGDGAVVPNNAGAKDTYVITSGGVQSLERKSANTSNTFTFSGSGWGHNVGMSQWGAFAMAEKGYTYRDILNFYYTGITLS